MLNLAEGTDVTSTWIIEEIEPSTWKESTSQGLPVERKESLSDPPPNPKGGRTLIVDARDPHAYIRPSEALKAADEADQVFVRPGIYEDKVFVADRPVLLIGAGRDHVQIYNRRGGPLYLQRVPPA